MAEQHELHILHNLQPGDPMTEHQISNRNLHGMELEASNDLTAMAGALTTFDVFSLNVNRMIGTGIFMTPSLVLALTGSWKDTIVLWAVGYMFIIISMFLYLSFAAVIPGSTGELAYIDEATSYDGTKTPRGSKPFVRPVLRHLGNGLFAYTVYSILFVTLFNSGTNSLQVGRQVLLFIEPHQEDPNRDLMRFIAVVVLSVVCLSHYFSAYAGRAANRYFCVVKLLVLLAILVVGVKRAIVGPKIGFPQLVDASKSFSKYAQALLLVLFSFEGWENANSVAGELQNVAGGIQRTGHRILRRGSLLAIAVVGILYMLLNIVYVLSVDRDGSLPKVNAASSFVPQLFGNTTGAVKGWAILTAVSALGSLTSVIYTFSRVKQAIGAANILPYSNLWKQDCSEHSDCPQHNHEGHYMHKTPKGGLIMHWISTVIIIMAIAGVHNTVDMVTFPAIMQTYAHCLVTAFVTIGLLRLHERAKALDRTKVGLRWIWAPEGGCSKCLVVAVFLLYSSCGAFVVGSLAVPPFSRTVPHWIIPVVVGSILLLGALYYFTVFWTFASVDDTALRQNTASYLASRHRLSLLSFAGIRSVINKADSYDMDYNRHARRFGMRRHISYEWTSQGKETSLFWLLYWGFGGQLDTSPLEKAVLWWSAFAGQISDRFTSLFRGFERNDGSLDTNTPTYDAIL